MREKYASPPFKYWLAWLVSPMHEGTWSCLEKKLEFFILAPENPVTTSSTGCCLRCWSTLGRRAMECWCAAHPERLFFLNGRANSS